MEQVASEDQIADINTKAKAPKPFIGHQNHLVVSKCGYVENSLSKCNSIMELEEIYPETWIQIGNNLK